MRKFRLTIKCYDAADSSEFVPEADIRAALLYVGATLKAMPEHPIDTRIGCVTVVIEAKNPPRAAIGFGDGK